MDQYPFECEYCKTLQVIGGMDYDETTGDFLCYACGAIIDLTEQFPFSDTQ